MIQQLFPIFALITASTASSASSVNTFQAWDWIKDVAAERSPAVVNCAVQTIDRELQPEAYKGGDVGGPNQGIIEAQRGRLEKSPCFVSLVADFHRRLSEIGAAAEAKGSSIGVARIGERAGRDQLSGLKPGFALDVALEIAGGDRSLAFALLGVCGHDDLIASSPGTYLAARGGGSEKAISIKQNIRDAEQTIELLKASQQTEMLAQLEKRRLLEDTESRLAVLKKNLRDLNSGRREEIYCPGASPQNPLVVPGSLGEKTNLSSALQKKIEQVQDSKKNFIPAKYYHFIAAATLGCNLSRCGLSPNVVGTITGLLSVAYRGMRLCRALENYNVDLSAIEAKAQAAPDQKAYTERALDALFSMQECYKGTLFGDTSECPKISNGLESFLKKVSPLPRDVQKEKMNSYLSVLESARRWQVIRLGGPQSKLPCTPLANPLAHLPLYESVTGTGCKFSQDICDKGLRRLQTWDVDFEWSRNVHSQGGRFGAQSCSKTPSDWNLDKAACRALGNQQPSSSQKSHTGVK